MAQDESLHRESSVHPWIQRESQDDEALLTLLMARERAIDQGAKEGSNASPTPKDRVGRLAQKIAIRQVMLGIDSESFSPAYDIAQLEQERQIVQQNKHRLD